MIRLSVVCLLIASVAAAQPGKPPFTVAQLKAAWQARQDRHDKVMAKWTSTLLRAKGVRSGGLDAEMRARLGHKGGKIDPPEDETVEFAMSLSLDGAMARSREEGEGSWHEVAFDGSRLRDLQWVKGEGKEYPQGGVWKEEHFKEADRPEYRPLILFYRPLHKKFWPLSVDAFVVTNRRAVIHDRPCVEVEYAPLAMRCWIDQEAGYLIRRITHGRDGTGGEQIDIQYEGDGDQAVPASWTYASRDKQGSLKHSMRVTGLSITHGQSDPAGFKLPFLAGSYVFDDRENRAYIINPDGSERPVHPSERALPYSALVRTPPPPTPFLSTVLGRVVVAIGVCAALLLAYRLLSRLRKPSNP